MKRSGISGTFAAIGLVALGAAVVPARAHDIEFNFVLQPQQEVPPNNSNASGAAKLVYNEELQHYSLDVKVFGIGLSDLRNAGANGTPIHFHIAPRGSNGPIVVDVGFVGTFQNDGLGIRLQVNDLLFGGQQGNIFSNPSTNEQALFAGNMYLNVHTNAFPGGQIRGQAVPEPASALLLTGGLALAIRRRR